MAFQYRSSRSSNFLVFHISGSISWRLATFQLLIFVSTTSSSFGVKCSSWLLIIFLIGLSVTFDDFLGIFLKCSFHMWIRSSWLANFSLVLEVLFLLLISFTVCHPIRACISSTEFLVLLICILSVLYLFFLECFT